MRLADNGFLQLLTFTPSLSLYNPRQTTLPLLDSAHRLVGFLNDPKISVCDTQQAFPVRSAQNMPRYKDHPGYVMPERPEQVRLTKVDMISYSG